MNTKGSVSFTPVMERARISDPVGIRWLFDMEELPSVDITEDTLGHFLVCRDETGVAGVVGLERYGELAYGPRPRKAPHGRSRDTGIRTQRSLDLSTHDDCKDVF